MIRVLPKWYSEADIKLDRTIIEISEKLNLKRCFVTDSKTIENGKNAILDALIMIYENAEGEFTQEELKQFEAIKKDKGRGKHET